MAVKGLSPTLRTGGPCSSTFKAVVLSCALRDTQCPASYDVQTQEMGRSRMKQSADQQPCNKSRHPQSQHSGVDLHQPQLNTVSEVAAGIYQSQARFVG